MSPSRPRSCDRSLGNRRVAIAREHARESATAAHTRARKSEAFDVVLIHSVAEGPRVAAPDEFQLCLVLRSQMTRQDALADARGRLVKLQRQLAFLCRIVQRVMLVVHVIDL